MLQLSLGKGKRQVDNLFLPKCPRIRFREVHQMMLLPSLLLGVQSCTEMRAGSCVYELGPGEDFGSDSREEGDALPWLESLLSS